MPMTGKEVEVEVTRLNDQMKRLGLETRFTFAKGGRGSAHRLYAARPGRDESEIKIGSNLVVALHYVRGLQAALEVVETEHRSTLRGLLSPQVVVHTGKGVNS